MKQKYFLSLISCVFAISILLTSCEKSESDGHNSSEFVEGDDEISVYEESIFLSPERQEKTIQVTANCAWSVKSDASWISLTKSSGDGDGSFFFDVDENQSVERRQGILTISAKNSGKRVQITVVQDAKSETNSETKPEKLVFTINGVEFAMVKIKGGTFEMGATPEQENPHESEIPVQTVTVGDYYIGETEVTQALWEAVMLDNPSSYKGSNLPVDMVYRSECLSFISVLNRLTGGHFRLPSEKEWEFAARGGVKDNYTQYSGSADINEVAWHEGNSNGMPHSVKTKLPNEFGIYDMSGNVWEWCNNQFSYFNGMTPTNTGGIKYYSVRGGCYNSKDNNCRTACRNYYSSNSRSEGLGLRLAMTDPPANDAPIFEVSIRTMGGKKIYTINGVEFAMIGVGGSTFQMGATSEQHNPDENEFPVHSVSLSNYYIGETEVSQALWNVLMGENASKYQGDEYPVDNMTRSSCEGFISTLNAVTRVKFRMPTEAEWEFAARGGANGYQTQYAGGNYIDEVAWYIGNSDGKTHPVKSKLPNELGLYNMSGNVWEICEDQYGNYSPTRKIIPVYYVIRGGDCTSDAWDCRTTRRDRDDNPGLQGFRLAQ